MYEEILQMIKNGYYEKALKETNRLDHLKWQKYNIKGLIYFYMNNLKESKRIFELAINKFHYKYDDLLYNYAILLFENNNIDKSKKILSLISKKDHEVYEKLGDIDYIKRKYISSLKYYEKSYLLNPKQILKDKINEIVNTKKLSFQKIGNVFMGTMEIANQMNTYKKAFLKKQINVDTLNYYPNYLDYTSDFIFNMIGVKDYNRSNLFSKVIFETLHNKYDLFHFHFGTTLTIDNSDLEILKKLNKKMIMQYWGSEVRLYSKAKEINPFAVVKNKNEERIINDIKKISKYIDSCLVDYELAYYVKDYFENIFYYRVGIDVNKYNFIGVNILNKDKITIVHAPTSQNVKGTSYIMKAIDNLKNKYNIEFILVEGMKHEKAVEIYKKADLIIDQILLGSYGVFAVESMAMGKPVICWISDYMKEKYPDDLPLIIANPDTIQNKIEYIIKNKELLNDISRKSRKYVEKYHDMDIVSEDILDYYYHL
ncbi:glycosyltransferase [Oceanotoga teriensis]|uniref:glycosyltransferase n=1 Tax=Oceanotoga teriensis TaxID=515440 RepID=UPI0027138CF1|nr:glycosyltransferase [Oceanotoga teriensis]MDO7976080.1 glycosyltransferase [Oceanotoga teriensis]